MTWLLTGALIVLTLAALYQWYRSAQKAVPVQVHAPITEKTDQALFVDHRTL